jgi:hypothetical protein
MPKSGPWGEFRKDASEAEAEDQALQQGIASETVGTVDACTGNFAGGIQAG